MSITIAIKKASLVAIALAVLITNESANAALVGHYTFDTNLNNSGTTGAIDNATVLNGTPVAGVSPGISGNGLRVIKSEADSIQLPVSNTDLSATFTISAWYNQATGTTGQRYFVFEASTGTGISYGTGTTSPMNFGPVRYSSYIGGVLGPTTATTPLNTWHHVIQTFSTSGATTTMTVYVDGALLGTTTSAPTSSVAFAAINVANARNGQVRYFDGTIDDFGLWNETLTAGEAIAVYNLMTTPALNYNAGFAEELFQLHNAATGASVVNGATWAYATGLTGDVGSVMNLGNGYYAVKLDASGTGVMMVPEPSSFALALLGLAGLRICRRKK